MAYMTNREFAEHLFKQEKRNAYTDALIKEVQRLREELTASQRRDRAAVEDLNKAKQYADIIIEYRASKDKPDNGIPTTDKPRQFTDEEAQDLFGKENTEDKA